MNIKQLLLSIGIIAAMGAQAATASTLTLNPKIDKFVQDQFKSDQAIKSTVFVVLADMADSLASREDKSRYVYDTLRNKALGTQGPLVDFLQSKKIKFRQFYIENMIAVENPTADLINTLASRPDVARIMGNPLVKLKLPKANATLADNTGSNASGPEQNLVRIGATKVWEN